MVYPYMKNKGSAVRFCLWPLGFWLLSTRTVRTSVRTHSLKAYKHWYQYRYPYCI